MTLEPVSESPAPLARWIETLVPARQMAEVLAGTEFVPAAFRNRPDSITAAIMYGDELGIGPMQSLQEIYLVDGRPFLSATLCRALVFRAGHTITVHESTGQRCRLSGRRADRPDDEPTEVVWTYDMAKAAGLTGKSAWRAYPRSMLAARATSDLARLLFPDVIRGVGYIAEDDTAAVLENLATPEADPAPAPRKAVPQRRTRPSLPSPGHAIATEDRPGPDGSVDVPIPETDPVPVAPPETPVEAPDTPVEDPAGVGPKAMGDRPFKALQAALTQALGRAPREERIAAMTAIVGRDIDSSAELTRAEGYAALAFLDRVNVGAAGLVKRDGTWQAVIYDPEGPTTVEDPPADPWGSVDEPFPEAKTEE